MKQVNLIRWTCYINTEKQPVMKVKTLFLKELKETFKLPNKHTAYLTYLGFFPTQCLKSRAKDSKTVKRFFSGAGVNTDFLIVCDLMTMFLITVVTPCLCLYSNPHPHPAEIDLGLLVPLASFRPWLSP